MVARNTDATRTPSAVMYFPSQAHRSLGEGSKKVNLVLLSLKVPVRLFL